MTRYLAMLLAVVQKEVRQTVRDFVDEEVIPIIEHANREEKFPMHLIPKIAEMGLFGADGKMVKRWIGWSPTVDKEMRAAIEGQLGKALAPEKALAPGKAATAASKSGEKTTGGPARCGGRTTQR